MVHRILHEILRMFNRHWLLSTVLVVVGLAVLTRLGIWQLDRLEQRRYFNARVTAQVDHPVLELEGEALNADLANMEYRQVLVRGEYDHAQEIALRNQAFQNQWGVHLVTPLHIAGSNMAILVDRGWIPAGDFESGDWSKYNEPGLVEVRGVLRASQSKADFGSRSDPIPLPGGDPIQAWNFVNIQGIAIQISYPLLPAYIQQAPDSTWTGLPYRSMPELELSEGPHLGYAIQWFTFAAILGLGYPYFIRRQETRRSSGTHVQEKVKVAL